MSSTDDVSTPAEALRQIGTEEPPALELAEYLAAETDGDVVTAQDEIYAAIENGRLVETGEGFGGLRLAAEETETDVEEPGAEPPAEEPPAPPEQPPEEPASVDPEGGGETVETAEVDHQEPAENGGTEAAADAWSDLDFSTTEPGIWAPPQITFDTWMCRKESKQPYAPWTDADADVTCNHDSHAEPTTCAECEHHAGYKWGSDGSREHVHTDHETAKEFAQTHPALSSDLVFIQRESDPFVFVDGDDVRCPESGRVHPTFEKFLEQLGLTYADVSTSGGGVHAIYRGEIPLEGVAAPAFEIDEEPWGENEDKPVIEIYDGKHVCVATGDHVAGSGTEINEWNVEAVENILREYGFNEEPKPSADHSADLSDHTPSATKSTETTGEIRDVFAALDRLDPKRVADKTIVRRWTRGNRSFLPVWGSPDDNGTANYVDEKIWHDTGDAGGYGGPAVMAAIDAGLVHHAGVTPSDVSGETFFEAVDHLRELGFDIPELDESAARQTRSDYLEADLAQYSEETEPDPYTDHEAQLRACLRARAAGAVAAETEPPTLALMALMEHVMGYKPRRDMSDATRELLVEAYHDIEEADLNDLLD